jgi:hypothetical protein
VSAITAMAMFRVSLGGKFGSGKSLLILVSTVLVPGSAGFLIIFFCLRTLGVVQLLTWGERVRRPFYMYIYIKVLRSYSKEIAASV